MECFYLKPLRDCDFNIAILGNYKWSQFQQALMDGFNSIKEVEVFPIVLQYYPLWK